MANRPIAGDYNTDVLWKPPRMSNRTRTISTDSSESDMPGIPARRFSLSEYFGVHRQGSLTSETGGSSEMIAQKKSSITENTDFKELLRRQKRILED